MYQYLSKRLFNKFFFTILALLLCLIALKISIFDETKEQNATINPEIETTVFITTPNLETSTSLIKNEPLTTPDVTDKLSTNGLKLQQRPNWRVEGNFAEQFNALNERFLAGDLIAGYQIARNLQSCQSAPTTETAYQHAINTGQALQETANYFERLSQRFAKCSGIAQSVKTQYLHYLQATAAQGFTPAQESFAHINTEFYMKYQAEQQLTREKYIAKREGFIKQKLDNLHQAAEHGSLLAIKNLANMYYSQNYGENGSIKAYAFNYVILELTDDNKLYNRYQWYQERLSQALTHEQIAHALALAQQLLDKIAINGTLYSPDRN